MALTVTRIYLVLLLIIHNVVSQEAESCITYLDDCDGCQPIFDDNLTTFMTLQSGDGIYQESHRLLINQTCVKITEVEFLAVLSFDIHCSELSFLFVNQTNGGPCRIKERCEATEITKNSSITQCSITCPKRTNYDEKKLEVTLMYGLFPTTWQLRDLGIRNITIE